LLTVYYRTIGSSGAPKLSKTYRVVDQHSFSEQPVWTAEESAAWLGNKDRKGAGGRGMGDGTAGGTGVRGVWRVDKVALYRAHCAEHGLSDD
jgi:hypothetical protein